MSSSVTIDDLSRMDLSLLCRGCLSSSGEMKNMVEWGLIVDYYRLTNIQVDTAENPSLLLCVKCEDVIYRCRSFKDVCQKSDVLMRTAIEKRQIREGHKTTSTEDIKYENNLENILFTELTDKSIIMKITAPNMDTKIQLPCHYCQNNFLKRTDLTHHLKKQHNVGTDFNVDLKYYCHIQDCNFYINSGKEKFFTNRKYLNQHTFKVHREKVCCNECGLSFFNEASFKRHTTTCNQVFACHTCNMQFNMHEKLLVHLMRKHPDIHKQYKNNRKCGKSTSVNTLDATKKSKREDKRELDKNNKCDKLDYLCDSPKRSFATQTLELEKHIKNDVTLPPWQAEKLDETKKDEIATQTVFEDLLSLKSNISEEETIFSDSVSLSDIQTQTFPFEFGLSRSNKETLTCETQSPDLSIKETQTCLCLYDSPKPSFKCLESVSSNPSTFNVLTSTETQTLDFDLLNFTSAETQTCFDDRCENNL